MLDGRTSSILIYVLSFLSNEIYEMFQLGNSTNVISVQK
jgi:hypothetical protein